MKNKTIIDYSIIIAMLWAFFVNAPRVCALEGTEYQIKGAMMVNFIKFVEWPESEGASTQDLIIIGIIGRDDFGETLDHIEGRMIGGKRLAVRQFESPGDIDACQILFVSRSETYRINTILERVAGKPVLTIGEAEAFTRLGGMIRFFLEQKHVRFEVNTYAAADAGLRFNAKLLEIARLME